MARRAAPWMTESIQMDKERVEADKLAKKARGSRLYAVLPWRGDARYDGADVIRWFRTRANAEKFAELVDGGRGLVVRDWTMLSHPDAAGNAVGSVGTASAKTPAELEREIRAVMGPGR